MREFIATGQNAVGMTVVVRVRSRHCLVVDLEWWKSTCCKIRPERCKEEQTVLFSGLSYRSMRTSDPALSGKVLRFTRSVYWSGSFQRLRLWLPVSNLHCSLLTSYSSMLIPYLSHPTAQSSLPTSQPSHFTEYSLPLTSYFSLYIAYLSLLTLHYSSLRTTCFSLLITQYSVITAYSYH